MSGQVAAACSGPVLEAGVAWWCCTGRNIHASHTREDKTGPQHPSWSPVVTSGQTPGLRKPDVDTRCRWPGATQRGPAPIWGMSAANVPTSDIRRMPNCLLLGLLHSCFFCSLAWFFLLLFYRIIIFYFCRQCSLLVCPEIKSNCPGTSANYPNGYYSLVYTLEPRIIFSLKFIMSNLHNNFALV